jgi:peptidoglycan/LPS O-acetylase OafA/YrhL
MIDINCSIRNQWIIHCSFIFLDHPSFFIPMPIIVHSCRRISHIPCSWIIIHRLSWNLSSLFFILYHSWFIIHYFQFYVFCPLFLVPCLLSLVHWRFVIARFQWKLSIIQTSYPLIWGNPSKFKRKSFEIFSISLPLFILWQSIVCAQVKFRRANHWFLIANHSIGHAILHSSPNAVLRKGFHQN